MRVMRPSYMDDPEEVNPDEGGKTRSIWVYTDDLMVPKSARARKAAMATYWHLPRRSSVSYFSVTFAVVFDVCKLNLSI